jgi:hypothetical protein
MSQYLILIYEDEAQYATASPGGFRRGVRGAQRVRGGCRWARRDPGRRSGAPADHTATSIHRGSEVTDGPFVETKERSAATTSSTPPDLDTALAVAKAVPARFGGVEVRPS